MVIEQAVAKMPHHPRRVPSGPSLDPDLEGLGIALVTV